MGTPKLKWEAHPNGKDGHEILVAVHEYGRTELAYIYPGDIADRCKQSEKTNTVDC